MPSQRLGTHDFLEHMEDVERCVAPLHERHGTCEGCMRYLAEVGWDEDAPSECGDPTLVAGGIGRVRHVPSRAPADAYETRGPFE